MTLSGIVRYLNHLDTLNVQEAAGIAVSQMANITHIVRTDAVQIPGVVDDLISIQTDMKTSLEQYEQKLHQLKKDVLSLIEQHEPEYFAASQRLYQGMRLNEPSQILNRELPINDATKLFLRDRLNAHANWQYPGMVIRPAHSHWLENLVALDPMYLVDTRSELFAPVTDLFTPEYQRRLRYYVIEEYTSKKIFWNLPQKQFGFVYAFHYFNFKPWEILRQYLDEVFELLRDGGTFLFGFNDCDQWRGVALLETNYCCYTPGRLIREHALKLGYEIAHDYNDQGGTAWLELRKPGIANSLRGGQALAGIFRKTVDKPLKELYNEMTLYQLIEVADFLKVDISQDKTKREFNIKKVRRTLDAHFETENYPEETLRELFKPKEN